MKSYSLRFLLLFWLTLAVSTSALGNEERLERQELLDNSHSTFKKIKQNAETRLAEFQAKQKEAIKTLSLSSKRKSELLADTLLLEAHFNENDVKLKAVQEKINERASGLNGFFGVLNEAALAFRTESKSSLISAQYPERIKFLDRLLIDLKQQNSIIDFDQLEKFSTEVIREIKGSEEIAIFSADVVDGEGKRRKKKVTRLGAFSATQGSDFLFIETETSTLSVLARQPARKFRKYSINEEPINDKLIPLTIDLTRGEVLSLLDLQPTLIDRLNQGGPIGLTIIFLGLASLLITSVRYRTLNSLQKLMSSEDIASEKPRASPLTRLTQIANDNQDENFDILELRLEEGLASEYLKISKQMSYLKFIAIVSPLLGLLGTVSGMILTFQSISLSGTSDPNLMAGGISQALVTTVLGLCVAIPSLLFFTILSEKVKRINDELEQYAFSFLTSNRNRVDN